MTEAHVSERPVPVEDSVYEDYWGVDATQRWYLPDGKQYIEFKIMNEGERAEFQKKSSRDLVVQGKTGDARVAVDPAGDRHALLKTSVIGWNLMQRDPKADSGWSPAPFDKRNFEQWLVKADPKIVDKLEFEIRLANPWMQSDMTVEQMKEQIDDLERMIAEKEREELGEGRS